MTGRGWLLINRKNPLKRRLPIPKRRRTPRRGRLVDEQYFAWIATQPGVVRGGICASVHHVRFMGSPKSDRRTLPMEWGYHTYQEGPESIEALGKQKWQSLHHVDIEAAITRYQERYLAEHPEVKW